MKLFWMKNKALIAALCAVLVLGVAFWGGLRLFEGNQMQDVFVRTAYADAEATVLAHDIAKIWGENFLRVMRQVQAVNEHIV